MRDERALCHPQVTAQPPSCSALGPELWRGRAGLGEVSALGQAGGAQGPPGSGRAEGACLGGPNHARLPTRLPTSFPDMLAADFLCFVSLFQANSSVFSLSLSGPWQRPSLPPPGRHQDSRRAQHARAPHAGVPTLGGVGRRRARPQHRTRVSGRLLSGPAGRRHDTADSV